MMIKKIKEANNAQFGSPCTPGGLKTTAVAAAAAAALVSAVAHATTQHQLGRCFVSAATSAFAKRLQRVGART
jgi:hypothetical protein